MTRKSENFELTNNSNADSNDDRAYISALPNWKDRYAPEPLAQSANNQSDLIDRRVIPNLEIEKKTDDTHIRSGWAAARQEARQESERNIAAGNSIHQIRYGDTLWDIASASFKKNNGQKPSDKDIVGEVSRLAKKNNIANPNKIALGTAIDTSPDRGQAPGRAPNYYDFNGRPRTNDLAAYPNRTPNYYEFSGGQHRFDPGQGMNRPQNYYDSNRRSGTPDLRLPNRAMPLTPETTRDLLNERRPDSSFTPRPINPGMEITPQAKQTAAWRNGHNENLAKARRGAPTVAFYGDSITHGLQLNPNFKSFAGGSENFGVDSDRTENLLYRLRDGEANFPGGRKPDTAVLLIGTNNIGSQSAEKIAAGILANARELSNRLPGTEIVVMGILPRGAANDAARTQVTAINNLVRQQLQGVPAVRFVDVGPQLLDSRGNMRPGIFQKDNLHPTYNAGYSAILNALKPYVRTRS